MRYCEKRGWKTELVDYTEGTSGGYKEIVFNVNAEDAYGNLKYESGVHRVQRVPDTETQGRVHTSAATVVVLPEVDEFDIDLQVSDIRKDLFCASGPGGQSSEHHVFSCAVIRHIPTGIVAQCQDQKSQLKNYDISLAGITLAGLRNGTAEAPGNHFKEKKNHGFYRRPLCQGAYL